MMNKLQQYFPMIRTKEEVLKEIENNSKLKEIYENWQEDEREEFGFCNRNKRCKNDV